MFQLRRSSGRNVIPSESRRSGKVEVKNVSWNKDDETVNLVEFWGLPPLIPLLQCVNRLGFEVCSVNSCQSEQGSLFTFI